MASRAPSEKIRTTERSLDIVREIQRRGGARIADIVDEFDMAKSTAYKHLMTLERRGYLVKEDGQYHIGLKFTNRGEFARARKLGYRLAEEKVEDLAKSTDGEVDFVVESDGRGMTLHVSYDRSNPYPERSVDAINKHWRPGTYYHLHCLAGGKAILAEFPESRVEAIIDRWGLPERTDRTITDREELFAELKRVRERGIAYTQGEYADGLTAIAKLVLTPDGDPLGSLAINAPTYKAQDEAALAEMEAELTEATAEMERELESCRGTDEFTDGAMF